MSEYLRRSFTVRCPELDNGQVEGVAIRLTFDEEIKLGRMTVEIEIRNSYQLRTWHHFLRRHGLTAKEVGATTVDASGAYLASFSVSGPWSGLLALDEMRYKARSNVRQVVCSEASVPNGRRSHATEATPLPPVYKARHKQGLKTAKRAADAAEIARNRQANEQGYVPVYKHKESQLDDCQRNERKRRKPRCHGDGYESYYGDRLAKDGARDTSNARTMAEGQPHLR